MVSGNERVVRIHETTPLQLSRDSSPGSVEVSNIGLHVTLALRNVQQLLGMSC